MKKIVAALLLPWMSTIAVDLEDSEPLLFYNKTGLVISGFRFSNESSQPCISINYGGNITIENCWFGPSRDGEGVKLWRTENVTIRNCYFEHVLCGVNAIECKKIVVDNNNFYNIKSTRMDVRGNVAMFNNCTGGGLRITNNRAENIEGECGTEDLVNLFQSVGLADDPILVAGNRFRGGGPSTSGGGLLAGDGGGAYAVIRDNILVNPGNYGVAISGGKFFKLLDNTIYQEQKPWSNIPAYLWDWENLGNCSGHVIRGNKSTYYDKHGRRREIWLPGNCRADDIGGNDWNAGLTADILPEKLWDSEMPKSAHARERIDYAGHKGVRKATLIVPLFRTVVAGRQLGADGGTFYDLRGKRIAPRMLSKTAPAVLIETRHTPSSGRER